MRHTQSSVFKSILILAGWALSSSASGENLAFDKQHCMNVDYRLSYDGTFLATLKRPQSSLNQLGHRDNAPELIVSRTDTPSERAYFPLPVKSVAWRIDRNQVIWQDYWGNVFEAEDVAATIKSGGHSLADLSLLPQGGPAITVLSLGGLSSDAQGVPVELVDSPNAQQRRGLISRGGNFSPFERSASFEGTSVLQWFPNPDGTTYLTINRRSQGAADRSPMIDISLPGAGLHEPMEHTNLNPYLQLYAFPYSQLSTKKQGKATQGVFWVDNTQTDKAALYISKDGSFLRRKLIYVDDTFDIKKPVYGSNGTLLGVQITAELSRFIPLTKMGEHLAAAIQHASTGMARANVEVLDVSHGAEKAVVRIESRTSVRDLIVTIRSGEIREIDNICKANLYETEPAWLPFGGDGKLLSYLSVPEHDSDDDPLAVVLHGGPFVRDTWRLDAYSRGLLQRGFKVLRLNYPGSAGFGRDWASRMSGDYGEALLKVISDVTLAMEKERRLSPQYRIIVGESFGGFLSLLAGKTESENSAFKAAIASNPPTDWVTLLEGLSPQRHQREPYLKDFLGDPARPDERSRLEQLSALNAISQFRTPTLLLYGSEDANIPPSQSERLIKAHSTECLLASAEIQGAGHRLMETHPSDVFTLIDEFLGRFLDQPDPASLPDQSKVSRYDRKCLLP